MGMVVRTNMAAINANNHLANASKAQQNGMQKLASGLKINAAKDDASGLAITEKMKNQIKALDTAKDNCEDGANMIQTAEGYMKETHDILTRMTELSEKAANGLLKDEDRGALQNEMDQLCGEIDRMASTANFNGVKLLDGSLGSKGVVTISSDNDGKYEYIRPSGTGYGGDLNVASGTTAGSYKVTSYGAAGSDATVKAKLLDEYGQETGAEVTFTVGPQKGDKITLDSNGKGTSANGIKLTAANNKNATLTFNGTSWAGDNGETVAVTSVEVDSTASNISGTGQIFSFANGDEKVKFSGNGIDLQIGESSTSADRMSVKINSFHTDSLFGGLGGVKNKSIESTDTASDAVVKVVKGNDSSTYKNSFTINIKDQDNASAAADAIRQVANYVSDERGKLGAQQNRLEHTVNNLATASENTTAAKSRILDTDMAKEMMEYTSKNVIAQAAQSMLAQANSQPQNVLSLLQ